MSFKTYSCKYCKPAVICFAYSIAFLKERVESSFKSVVSANSIKIPIGLLQIPIEFNDIFMFSLFQSFNFFNETFNMTIFWIYYFESHFFAFYFYTINFSKKTLPLVLGAEHVENLRNISFLSFWSCYFLDVLFVRFGLLIFITQRDDLG